MEECKVSPSHGEPNLTSASWKRMAWAKSRDSWQEDQAPPAPPPEDGKSSPAADAGPITNKIVNWFTGCRTPLGASLDEQSSSLSKGLQRNGCSFEDDLSLGAEANHLQSSTAKPDSPGYVAPAREKRSQFRLKGRSMNSTGSGKSSGTLSSVSELLELYEEDPEEILYNLGFGREEPDIPSKIPSRFFNSSSSAKGIDIKVYLGAQVQRMELENPNFALTSRFRQTEVLATVANVFSEIYSQVSGQPLQKIVSQEGQGQKINPALNAAKILKRNITRSNLLAAAEGSAAPPTSTSDPDKVEARNQASEQGPAPEPESKPQPKVFKKKDSSGLATVAEETNQGAERLCPSASEQNPPLRNGEIASPSTSEQNPPLTNGEVASPSASEQNPALRNGEVASPSASEQNPLQNPFLSDGEALPPVASEQNLLLSNGEASGPTAAETPASLVPPDTPLVLVSVSKEAIVHAPEVGGAQVISVSSDASSLLPVQLSQPRDSFEMEELQSTEDEVSGPGCLSRVGWEHLLRTASQQSDSSGFAEEPSTNVSANLEALTLRQVQESTDSCDSETTLTSHAGGLPSPLVLDHPVYEKLQGEEPLPQPSAAPSVPVRTPEEAPQHVDQVVPASVNEEACGASGDLEAAAPPAGLELDLVDDLGTSTETNPSTPSGSSTPPGPVAEFESLSGPSLSSEQGSGPGVGSEAGGERDLSTSAQLQGALRRAQQRAPAACEERTGRVWVRARDLQGDAEARERNPLLRSSSLPTSWISPTRVVSSVHIQLGQGAVKHHPSAYRYLYEEEESDHGSAGQGEDVQPQAKCRSTLIINPAPPDGNTSAPAPETQADGVGAPPYPLNIPQYLTRSSSSLYSAPADFPRRLLADSPLWSTSSVPDLSQNTTRPRPLLPQHAHLHSASYFGEAASSSNHRTFNAAHYSHAPGTANSPYTPTHTAPYAPYAPAPSPQFSHPLHPAPQATPLPPPHVPYTPPLGLPYSGLVHQYSAPHSAPYGFNLQGSPYHPQVPVPHPHSAPYSLPYAGAPYHPAMAYGQQGPFSPASAPFTPPSSLLPCDSPTPAMSSTEMQLRRVLHEIRDTVQSLGQSPTMPQGSTSSGLLSPAQPVLPLYEELQMRRRSLNVFRSQMMDLELTLMRQQAMVYQHLGPEERREAEQLQRLRTAVRQELQELELQLEDRLLTLEEQLRLCRHPLGMTRGHSIESLSSTSALRAMEPVCDLLREQQSLQSQLGYDAPFRVAGSSVSARSSRAASPARPPQRRRSPSPQRGGLYRTCLNLTPAAPSRPGAAGHPPASTDGQDTDEAQGPGEEQRGGDTYGGGNDHLQQLIAEIKHNLAEEIRQEIVNELLAAVSPRRSPVPARERPV
ncbi:LOW QUALITY PROTEIN: protein ITPRID2 [Brachyhypopomus gauderio]|uniref:LOW QUALITY PROTEIN: protein ITPRID2 n=1 Tax=Brachyhypopomus gauderio TaxID=698409 RepID=UPI00404283C9